MGANPQQTLIAFREAEAYPGPSLILAYSHCIAHGYDLRHGLRQQDLAAAQVAATEKYASYEDMSGWRATRFHPPVPAAG